jgi:hypothetical protein
MNMGDKSLAPVMDAYETRELFTMIAMQIEKELAEMTPEDREKAMDALEKQGVRFRNRQKKAQEIEE